MDTSLTNQASSLRKVETRYIHRKYKTTAGWMFPTSKQANNQFYISLNFQD